MALVMAHAPRDVPRVRGPSNLCPLESQVWNLADLCKAANLGVLVATEPHVHHSSLSHCTADLHDTAVAQLASIVPVALNLRQSTRSDVSGVYAAFASRYMVEPIRADK